MSSLTLSWHPVTQAKNVVVLLHMRNKISPSAFGFGRNDLSSYLAHSEINKNLFAKIRL